MPKNDFEIPASFWLMNEEVEDCEIQRAKNNVIIWIFVLIFHLKVPRSDIKRPGFQINYPVPYPMK